MYLTQNEYLALSKRVIKHFGKSSMLRDNDAIGEIASYIINADTKYDPTKGMTQNSWRMLNGKYGVLVFLAKQKRYKRPQSLEDSPSPFVDNFMNEVFSKEIFDIVNSDTNISQRERAIFHDRHNDCMSLRQIGAKHSLTCEYIRQILIGIYKKIRVHYES